MLELFLFNKILIFLINIIGVPLAFWVYLTNRKSRSNQIFLCLIISILFWITFSYLSGVQNQVNSALLFRRLTFGAVSLFFITAYFFSIFFPKKDKKRYPILDKVVLSFGTILFFLSVFTDFIIQNVKLKEWGTETIIGKGMYIFYIIVILLTFLILFNFFKKYFILSIKEKLKIQYFLVGISIFAFLNLIFNIVSPILLHTFKYNQFGNYSAIFVIGFTALAIVKRELFDIKVVLTELLVGVIGLILFIQSIIAETLGQKIFGFALFILFCISGYFLIRSVLKEIELRKELEKAYKELKKIDKSKTEFLSITSHQLRSPLTAIKGYLSMVLSGNYGKVEGGVKKFLENVYISSERLIKLVNNLLDVNRLQMGKMKFEFEDIQIEDIIKDVIKDFLPQAKEKGLSLKFVSRQARNIRLPKVKADSQKIRQVVLNLVDNAIKYTEEGEVRVEIQNPKSKIRIIVEDTGIGIDKEEINEIFKMFDRGGTKSLRVNPEGTGIGLYIAREMVKAHKGKIWAEPRKKGSRFIVELPIAHE